MQKISRFLALDFARISFTIFTCMFLELSGIVVAAPIEVIEGQPDVVTDGGRTYQTKSQIERESSVLQYRSESASQVESRNSSGALFVKIQELETEVRELRGLLEQQAYLIDQLTKRRMDDYLDLDRRISELQGGVSGGHAPATSTTKTSTNSPASTTSSSNTSVKSTASSSQSRQDAEFNGYVPVPPSAKQADQAKDVYRAAYQKVKDRQFDEAKFSLVAFINDHPDSRYVPNAHFWLGELYYLDSDLENSRDAFYTLVTAYSSHRKVADAKFKLGKIYHQLGKSDQARTMLQSVLSDHPDSKAVNPAREYLKNSLR